MQYHELCEVDRNVNMRSSQKGLDNLFRAEALECSFYSLLPSFFSVVTLGRMYVVVRQLMNWHVTCLILAETGLKPIITAQSSYSVWIQTCSNTLKIWKWTATMQLIQALLKSWCRKFFLILRTVSMCAEPSKLCLTYHYNTPI